jgi:hypothetical protein
VRRIRLLAYPSRYIAKLHNALLKANSDNFYR